MFRSTWGYCAALTLGLAAQVLAQVNPVPKAVEAREGRDITWRLAGPSGGGWIQSMTFDPQQPDTLYVGCDVGGFYFSTNAGRTFEIRNRGLRDYFVEAISVHPRDRRIILLGTESGLHRTADQGRTWQWVRDIFPKPERFSFSAPIGAVCFDPLNPTVAYAGVGRPRWDKSGAGAIFRSEDTGVTWRRVDGGRLPPKAIVSDIKVKPGDSRVVLAATSEGVFRSDNGGADWQLSSDGLPHRYTEELAFAPSSPQIVYVTLRCTAHDQEPWNGGVFRSEDAGRTWRAANGEGLPRRVAEGKTSRTHSSNPKELVVDPRDANVVYVGHRDWVTAGIYKTTDGGGHWSRCARRTREETNMDYGWITQWGPAVECLALSPAAPDRLAFGTSGHVFVTTDAGKSWQQRYAAPATDGTIAGNGLAVTCAWRVVPDPVRKNRLYFCYMDIGLLISNDNGMTFRRSFEGMKMSGNCFGVAVDPQAPETIWATTGWWNRNEGDVCRSEDGGKTWRVVGEPKSGLPAGQVLELLLDQQSPTGNRRLVAASNGNGIFETRDGGSTWHTINGNLPASDAKKPRGLLLDATNPAHLIAALDRNLFETQNGGQTWQPLGTAGALPTIQQLTADPKHLRTLYVAGREHFDPTAKRLSPGGVYRSEDAGQTWQRLLDFRFVASVAVSPLDATTIYVTTKDDPFHDDAIGEGVLKSTDGGRTWQHENTGLSHLNVKAICLSPLDPTTLFISTSGNSVFIGRDAGGKNK
ncbi:MAG: hypothetical protein WCO56_09550 [Verrucomicrobiota bacterium]